LGSDPTETCLTFIRTAAGGFFKWPGVCVNGYDAVRNIMQFLKPTATIQEPKHWKRRPTGREARANFMTTKNNPRQASSTFK
jgi:hypothetical protein